MLLVYSDKTISTSEITEGDNLYYTTSRANSAIDTRVSNTYINSLAIDARSGNTTNGRVLTANGLGGGGGGDGADGRIRVWSW